MGLLRITVTGLLMFLGALSLYAGLGIQFDVPGKALLGSYGILIGITFLLLSILIAKSGWTNGHDGFGHPNK